MSRVSGPIQVFGTVTSPYVRRVRVIAAELGIEAELINSREEAGQAKLRDLSPVWKVPAAAIDGQPVFDSAVIARHLLHLHGPGPFAAFDPNDVDEANRMTVIDGALDALINVFYLGMDGVDAATASYLAKQRERAASACAWLESKVKGDKLSPGDALHLSDLALGTTVGWMLFRETYPIREHAGLMRCFDRLNQREHFASTAPHD